MAYPSSVSQDELNARSWVEDPTDEEDRPSFVFDDEEERPVDDDSGTEAEEGTSIDDGRRGRCGVSALLAYVYACLVVDVGQAIAGRRGREERHIAERGLQAEHTENLRQIVGARDLELGQS